MSYTKYVSNHSVCFVEKHLGRHDFVNNSHRTQSNPRNIFQISTQSDPIQSMDESNPWTSLWFVVQDVRYRTLADH